MKKFFAVFVLICFTASISGCGTGSTETGSGANAQSVQPELGESSDFPDEGEE